MVYRNSKNHIQLVKQKNQHNLAFKIELERFYDRITHVEVISEEKLDSIKTHLKSYHENVNDKKNNLKSMSANYCFLARRILECFFGSLSD